MTGEHAVVITRRDIAALGIVGVLFLAGVALLGWAVGRG